MNKFFILASILINLCNLFSYTLKDSIESPKINLDFILKNDTVEVTVNNLSNDSLLTIVDPFIVQGYDKKTFSYPWATDIEPYNGPNTAYIINRNEDLIFVPDGYFKYIFNFVPNICLLPPNRKIVFKCVLPAEYKTSIDDSYKALGYLTYGYKKEFDSIMSKKFPDSLTSYIKDTVYCCNLKTLGAEETNFLYYRLIKKIETDISFSKEIWKIFRYIAWRKE